MNNMEQEMNQLSELRACVSVTQNQITKQSTDLSELSAKRMNMIGALTIIVIYAMILCARQQIVILKSTIC